MFLGEHVVVQHELMERYGVELAVFMQDLNNEILENGVCRDFGRAVPMTNEDLETRFSYMSFAQIKKAIAKLKKLGVVSVVKRDGLNYYLVDVAKVNGGQHA